jgi:hypothetical protein
MPLSLKDRLNKLLLEKGLITSAKLNEALKIQKQKGGKLSDILVEQGFVNRKNLMVVLSQELGVPPINLNRYKIDLSLIKFT